MKRDYTLLKHHMNCNPDYIIGHAIVSGQLAKMELKTYEEYVKACNRQGTTYYNEALFNKFMGIEEAATVVANG